MIIEKRGDKILLAYIGGKTVNPLKNCNPILIYSHLSGNLFIFEKISMEM